MENELTIFGEATMAVAETKGKNYIVKTPFGEVKLKRDVDFGVIPGTKKPSLYKSGAEKICMRYGLLQHYTVENKIEQYDSKGLFFYYLVKCELVKIAVDGREYIFTSGYGSANTAEKRNGTKGANTPDAINPAVKMAQKRALVSAAISISGLSDMFSQDIEDEKFMEGAMETVLADDAPITNKQLQKLFATAGSNGYNKDGIKEKLNAAGFKSAKDITQKDFNKVCKLFEE